MSQRPATGRSVLVTGAGGLVGRQVIRLLAIELPCLTGPGIYWQFTEELEVGEN